MKKKLFLLLPAFFLALSLGACNAKKGGDGDGDGGGNGGQTTTVAVTGVSVNPTSLTLTVGGATGKITATVAPADATNKNVTWTSSAPAIATVANGVVTPVAAGDAVITVKTVDGEKTATCNVKVNPAEPVATTATVSVDLSVLLTWNPVPTEFKFYTGSETAIDLVAGDAGMYSAELSPEVRSFYLGFMQGEEAKRSIDIAATLVAGHEYVVTVQPSSWTEVETDVWYMNATIVDKADIVPPAEGEFSILFTVPKDWDKDNVYLYAWKDEEKNAEWPGVKLENGQTNGYGETQYTLTLNASVYDKFILHDNTEEHKTADLLIADYAEVAGIYIDNGEVKTWN